jgi:hypothetical protein
VEYHFSSNCVNVNGDDDQISSAHNHSLKYCTFCSSVSLISRVVLESVQSSNKSKIASSSVTVVTSFSFCYYTVLLCV